MSTSSTAGLIQNLDPFSILLSVSEQRAKLLNTLTTPIPRHSSTSFPPIANDSSSAASVYRCDPSAMRRTRREPDHVIVVDSPPSDRKERLATMDHDTLSVPTLSISVDTAGYVCVCVCSIIAHIHCVSCADDLESKPKSNLAAKRRSQ